jgi:hypothetical protein
VADGTLRAVAVPPGEHDVELRFESDALGLGLLISSLASLLLALLGLAALEPAWREGMTKWGRSGGERDIDGGLVFN